ncbi:MAG: deaminase [Candidatus Paceibacterota bacterium]|jgi:dCMP deaminase
MKSRNSDVVLVAYVPVPHAGYLKFFRAYKGSTLYVLGDEFIQQFQPLVRNLPAVTPEEVRKMIVPLDIFESIRILTPRSISVVQQSNVVVMPDEDVSHAMAEKYLSGVSVTFDGSWRLRWDWGSTQAKRRPEGERVVSKEIIDHYFMRTSFALAEKSPDWWRQIGSLLVRDGRTLLSAFNQHVPSEQSCYCYGDPRSNFEPGQCIDASCALHAETGIIAEAARRGVAMEGCDLYVTTFPCPPCAYACARTGIKRLFYADGYALISGAEELEARGVKIIRVEM